MDELSKLIERAQNGDKDSFGKIYELFYKRIYRYCQFNVGKIEVAQDLCQETFLRAFKSLPSFSPKGGSFQAYLFKIAHNLIIDWLRKKKEVSLEKHWDLQSEDRLEEDLERKEQSRKVKTALSRLNDTERQIIILRFFEEMTFAEIGKVVKVRKGALRVRIHRVLKKLKEQIGEP